MNKEGFINELKTRLNGLPKEDLDERISFYEEMISDRVEDGMSEEEAVSEIGPIDSVVDQIMSEIPLTRLVKQKVRPKQKMKTWQIVLLAVGSVVWVPLLIAFAAVAFALYIVLWALVISLYAVTLTFAACAISSIPMAFIFGKDGNVPGVLFSIAAGLVLAGLAIFLFFACIGVTKGVIRLTGKLMLKLKTSFVGKEK